MISFQVDFVGLVQAIRKDCLFSFSSWYQTEKIWYETHKKRPDSALTCIGVDQKLPSNEVNGFTTVENQCKR